MSWLWLKDLVVKTTIRVRYLCRRVFMNRFISSLLVGFEAIWVARFLQLVAYSLKGSLFLFSICSRPSQEWVMSRLNFYCLRNASATLSQVSRRFESSAPNTFVGGPLGMKCRCSSRIPANGTSLTLWPWHKQTSRLRWNFASLVIASPFPPTLQSVCHVSARHQT